MYMGDLDFRSIKADINSKTVTKLMYGGYFRLKVLAEFKSKVVVTSRCTLMILIQTRSIKVDITTRCDVWWLLILRLKVQAEIKSKTLTYMDDPEFYA